MQANWQIGVNHKQDTYIYLELSQAGLGRSKEHMPGIIIDH